LISRVRAAPHRARPCQPLGKPADLRVEERQRGDGCAVPPLDPLDLVVCLERRATGQFSSVDRCVLQAPVGHQTKGRDAAVRHIRLGLPGLLHELADRRLARCLTGLDHAAGQLPLFAPEAEHQECPVLVPCHDQRQRHRDGRIQIVEVALGTDVELQQLIAPRVDDER